MSDDAQSTPVVADTPKADDTKSEPEATTASDDAGNFNTWPHLYYYCLIVLSYLLPLIESPKAKTSKAKSKAKPKKKAPAANGGREKKTASRAKIDPALADSQRWDKPPKVTDEDDGERRSGRARKPSARQLMV